jgi:hypothetical protein
MMFCTYGETPIMFRPLLRTPSIKAPISVPMIEPRPPEIDVPPMTTAAIASISKETPAFGWPLISRELRIRPAIAEVRPLSE